MDIAWIFTTPGVGGIIVGIVMITAVLVFFGLGRWFLRGGKGEEPEWERMGWPHK